MQESMNGNSAVEVTVKLFTVTFPDSEEQPALGLTIYPFKAQILRENNEIHKLDANVITASLTTSQVHRGDLIVQVNGRALVDRRWAVTAGHDEDTLHQMLMSAVAHAAKPRTILFLRPIGPPEVIDQYVASLSQAVLFRLTYEQEHSMFETPVEAAIRVKSGRDTSLPLTWTQDQPYKSFQEPLSAPQRIPVILPAHYNTLPLLPMPPLGIAPLDYYPPLGGVSLPAPPLPEIIEKEEYEQSAEEEEIAMIVNAQLRVVEEELRRTDEEVRRATQLRWQHEEAELKRARNRATQAALESARRAEADLKTVLEAARAQRVAVEAKKRVDEEQRQRAERIHRLDERASRVADEVKKRVDHEVIRLTQAKEALSRLNKSIETTRGWETTIAAPGSILGTGMSRVPPPEIRKKRIDEEVRKRVRQACSQEQQRQAAGSSTSSTFFDPRPVMAVEASAPPCVIRTLRVPPTGADRDRRVQEEVLQKIMAFSSNRSWETLRTLSS